MRHTLLYIIGITVAALLLLGGCTTSDERRRMAALMAEADSMTRNYVTFTTDSVMLRVAHFYDRHGSPNEQLRAHYLLGCTYRDLGEAPQALEEYQNAIDRADTTASDCDNSLLCRVYSQMALLFYQQNLMSDNLRCLDNSVIYGYRAKDTLAVLNSIAHKILAYNRTNNTILSIRLFEKIYKEYVDRGSPDVGAAYAGLVIRCFLDNGIYDKAKQYIDIYELQSGYFDSCGNIQEGREFYYYTKGNYYLAVHQYDSAEHFFRKELLKGKDFNNQNAASRGLALLYQQTHKPDSAAKYALYSYEMNDSVYAHMATGYVEQASVLYDYTRHRQAAQQQKELADRERQKNLLYVTVILAMLMAGCYVLHRYRHARRVAAEKYKKQLGVLEQAQSDVLILRTQKEELRRIIHMHENTIGEQSAEVTRLQQHEQELSQMLKEKEETVGRQQIELAKYQKREDMTEEKAEIRLKNSPVYREMIAKVPKGIKLREGEWHELNKLVIDVLPNFYLLISSSKFTLISNEYRICLLLRLHVSPSATAHMIGISSSYVSRLSDKILHTLFAETRGSSKKLYEELLKYH